MKQYDSIFWVEYILELSSKFPDSISNFLINYFESACSNNNIDIFKLLTISIIWLVFSVFVFILIRKYIFRIIFSPKSLFGMASWIFSIPLIAFLLAIQCGTPLNPPPQPPTDPCAEKGGKNTEDDCTRCKTTGVDLNGNPLEIELCILSDYYIWPYKVPFNQGETERDDQSFANKIDDFFFQR